MIEVIPAIIPINKEQMLDEISKISNFAELVQIDISDGVFTKTKTWPYNGQDVDFFEKLKSEEIGWPKWETLNYEVHLMVQNPENILIEWIHTGVSSVVVHIESTDNFQNIIDLCRENEIAIGLAIKPSTDISKTEPFVSDVNFIQVMGSDNLGNHGVSLEDSAILMIKALRNKYPERIIGIDIGVNLDTKETLTQAGATRLISGGAILKSDNPEEVFRELGGRN